MANKVLDVEVSTEQFFRCFLDVTKPMHGLSGAKADVMSQLLYYNHYYRELSPSIREHVLFDYDTKQKIADNLNISRHNVLNNIARLRKLGYIRGTKLDPGFIIDPEDNVFIGYKFKINDARTDGTTRFVSSGGKGTGINHKASGTSSSGLLQADGEKHITPSPSV